MQTRGERLLLMLPLALLVLPFVIWPIVFGFLASFSNFSPFVARPHFVGLANYAFLLGDAHFLAAFRTAGIFTIVTVPAELLLGFAMAWLLRSPFRGRRALQFLLVIPWLTSPVANGVMWHFLFSGDGGIPAFLFSLFSMPAPPSPLGMAGQALPAAMLAEIWRNAPLVGFLFLPGLLAIPDTLWHAAILDGISTARVLAVIVVPSLRPIILAVTMVLLGNAIGSFDTMLMLTGGGPGTSTLTPALYSFGKAYQANNWVAGSTSAWCIGLVAGLVGLVYFAMSRGEEET